MSGSSCPPGIVYASFRNSMANPYRSWLEFLADPAVAAAVLAETSFEHDHSAIGLGLFAESAEPLAPRAARPALRWLRAKAYERLGDLELVESYGFVPVYD